MIEMTSFPADQALRMEMRARIDAHLAAQGRPPHLLLETCDRLELYHGRGRAERGLLRHLARVAAGLESPLLGEKAILGQVRQASASAQAAGTADPGLLRLFSDAIGIARRVRLHSGIDQGSVGHGQAVLGILEAQGRPRADETVLLIGVNALTASILRWLKARSASSFILANRSLERARELAQPLGIAACPLSELSELAPRAGVIISSTAAPHYILRPEHFARRPAAGGLCPSDPPRLVFDLAAPADVDPQVAALPGLRVWGLAAVEAAAAAQLGRRRALVPLAEAWLERELDRRCAQPGPAAAEPAGIEPSLAACP